MRTRKERGLPPLLRLLCINLWLLDCGAGFGAEVAGRRSYPVRFLELDERGSGGTAKLTRLIARRTGTACGDRVAVGVEVDLQGLYVVADHTDFNIAGKAPCRAGG